MSQEVSVAERVRENPSTSTRHRPEQLNIPWTSLRCILRKDLGMKPYKVLLVQELSCKTIFFVRHSKEKYLFGLSSFSNCDEMQYLEVKLTRCKKLPKERRIIGEIVKKETS